MGVGTIRDSTLKQGYLDHLTLVHWVVSKHTVNLVLVVIQQETVGLTRHSRNQSTWMYVIVTRVSVGRVLCGRGLRVQVDERYLGCHVHVEVSRTIQPEVGDSGCDNQWTCLQVWVRSIGTGRVKTGENYLDCHIHVDTSVSRTIQILLYGQMYYSE
jgi:hypothetical protein